MGLKATPSEEFDAIGNSCPGFRQNRWCVWDPALLTNPYHNNQLTTLVYAKAQFTRGRASCQLKVKKLGRVSPVKPDSLVCERTESVGLPFSKQLPPKQTVLNCFSDWLKEFSRRKQCRTKWLVCRTPYYHRILGKSPCL